MRIITILLLLLIVGCSNDNDEDQESPYSFLKNGMVPVDELPSVWAQLPYTSIEYSRIIGSLWCSGDPGYYSVTFRRDGSCEARGVLPTGAEGKFVGQIEIWDYAPLCRMLEEAGHLEREYDAGHSHSDTVRLSVFGEGGTQDIEVQSRGISGPPVLWAIYKCVDAIVARIDWLQKSDSPDPFPVNSVWQGTMYQRSPKLKYPVTLFVSERQGDRFEGLTWYPTPGNGLIHVTGRIVNSKKLFFTEDKVLFAERSKQNLVVAAGTKYSAELEGRRLHGRSEGPNQETDEPASLYFYLKRVE